MLVDVLKKSLDVSKQVVSLVVIAKALDAQASKFYKKYGFQQFKQDPMKLYFPMKSIEKLAKTLYI